MKVETLKKEGDQTFAENNLESASLKYSEALTLFPAHVGCLSNRSACKLAQGDIQGCIDDCSEALRILQVDIERIQSNKSEVLFEVNKINMLSSILPPSGSEKRRQWAIKTITRRGVAWARLGNYDEAVSDYTVASGLDPTNELLKSDLEKYKTMQSNNSI
jgi:tetratricopeptide (TPR) repeat protein